jgi:peptidoglycan/xylan/chitin deacetylase (PgdA/CDA1 family)
MAIGAATATAGAPAPETAPVPKAPAAEAPPGRRLAITVDDLPCVRCDGGVAAIADLNHRFVAALAAAKAPAIGFVNEARLQVNGERDARVALLGAWLDAGLALGNHGYAHRGLTATPLPVFEDDLLRGEVVTRAVLEARGARPEFFRYPYTQTGPTPEIKRAFEAFLGDHGYRVAPFTIEDADYMFDALYSDALDRGDAAEAAKIRAAGLAHATRMTIWFEGLGRDLLGREPAQVLLIHLNRLNADTLPERLRSLQARGYRFVTLAEALADPAYALPDEYVGKNGPSWLHRWAVARGLPSRLKEEPDPPDWVLAAWNARTARSATKD